MGEELTFPGGSIRLFVEAPLAANVRIVLGAAQSHYLTRVMRGRAGDSVRLFNGQDGEWLAAIVTAEHRGVVVAVRQKTNEQRDVPDVWLLFSPIKRTPADYLAQKATELGVRVLQPVMTRRSIVSRVNLGRLRANAIEAAEQSDRTSVPDTRAVISLPHLLTGWPRDRTLIFCDEAGTAKPLAEALASATGNAFAILVGPEGGFDPAERSLLREYDFVLPVTLGPRILRADTAALSALAIWQGAKGDWSVHQSGTV